MKNVKRAIALVLVVMLTALAGCSTGKVESSTAKSALTVSVWAGPNADYKKEIVKTYANANVTIDDVDYSNLMQKQLLSFQSKIGVYDLDWVNITWLKNYAESGYLMPLDDYVTKNKIDLSIYSPSLLAACKVDGKLYGLPTYAQTLMLTYDSAAFTSAGQKVPTTPEELVDVAKYFKSKGSGIAMPAMQGSGAVTVFEQLLYSSGGNFFNASGKLDLTSDACVYAATIYQELCQNSVNGSLAWHHDQVSQAVRTGVAPIGITMSGLAGQDSDPTQSKIVNTVKYATLPGQNGKVVGDAAFWVFSVPQNSQHPDQAFALDSWLCSTKIEKMQSLKNQQISAITSLSTDTDVAKKMPFLPVAMKTLETSKTDPLLKSFPTLQTALAGGLSQIASTNTSPKAMLASVQASLSGTDFSK